jgi:hypothetical protein
LGTEFLEQWLPNRCAVSVVDRMGAADMVTRFGYTTRHMPPFMGAISVATKLRCSCCGALCWHPCMVAACCEIPNARRSNLPRIVWTHSPELRIQTRVATCRLACPHPRLCASFQVGLIHRPPKFSSQRCKMQDPPSQ